MRICVFSGSSPGVRPEYAQAAQHLGGAVAERGWGLVYGGAQVGLMGCVADAALACGGEVIGVIPKSLALKEVAHPGVADLRLVDSMHERKAQMAELSDAFVALPGGFGTLEELFEVLTWNQLGIHRKPCGLLDVAGYFSPLLDFLDRATGERFLHGSHREMLISGDEPAALLDALAQCELPVVEKWLDRDQT